MKHEALIDSVARDMTDGEPPADFRARVVASLPPARRRWWPRAIIPAGAIGALALAVWAGTTGTTGPSGTAPAPVVAQGLSAGAPVIPVGPVLRVVPVARVVPAVSVEDLAWHARALSALPAAAPITIAPIQPIPISIAPITMEPIVFDPIALAAIDSRSGGRE